MANAAVRPFTVTTEAHATVIDIPARRLVNPIDGKCDAAMSPVVYRLCEGDAASGRHLMRRTRRACIAPIVISVALTWAH